MCYRIVSHKLRCDVRPHISDGACIYVDSFAKPTACGCTPAPEIRPWLRCDDHGCCRRSVQMVKCSGGSYDCSKWKPIEVHCYEQTHERSLTEAANKCIGSTMSTREEWIQLEKPINEELFDDECGYALPSTTADVLNTTARLLRCGRTIAKIQGDMATLLRRLQKCHYESVHAKRRGYWQERKAARRNTARSAQAGAAREPLQMALRQQAELLAPEVRLFAEDRRFLEAVMEAEEFGGVYRERAGLVVRCSRLGWDT